MPSASDTTELAALEAAFAVTGKLLRDQGEALTIHYGQLLLTQVKANASGRPGPRIGKTGDYLRSITMESNRLFGITQADVGTDVIYGRRLEYGFVGTDSLGRHYPSQKRRVTRPDDRHLFAPAVAGAQAELGYPYPHFAPALDKIGPLFAESALAMAETVLLV